VPRHHAALPHTPTCHGCDVGTAEEPPLSVAVVAGEAGAQPHFRISLGSRDGSIRCLPSLSMFQGSLTSRNRGFASPPCSRSCRSLARSRRWASCLHALSVPAVVIPTTGIRRRDRVTVPAAQEEAAEYLAPRPSVDHHSCRHAQIGSRRPQPGRTWRDPFARNPPTWRHISALTASFTVVILAPSVRRAEAVVPRRRVDDHGRPAWDAGFGPS
jgi:hypothetical protein